MRYIDCAGIVRAVKEMILHDVCHVEAEACRLIGEAAHTESNPAARYALEVIAENNREAAATGAPACQDTGLAVFFVKIGQEVALTGGLLSDALTAAVRQAYAEGFCRASVCLPLSRKPTGDNAPPVVHTLLVGGDTLEIGWMAKGAGAENMSALHMLTPNAGEAGIISAVTATVRAAGANPCPPVILGVGIGGTSEYAALIAKYALTRATGTPSHDAEAAALERKLLRAVNATGIGAQGFGGGNTCLAVHVETYPTHIGMLPLAVNLQCHCVRHGTVVL